MEKEGKPTERAGMTSDLNTCIGKKPHPAKYNEKFIEIFADMLRGCRKVLDPFGGTGKIAILEKYGFETVNVEIEPEWATSICGDSTSLPFKDHIFDAICTSPTYGNRMADSFIDHKPEKSYIRNTYHHTLGRTPSSRNTGRYHFGEEYLALHEQVYAECKRVLKPGGKFVLNTKNFIHSSVETNVTGSHAQLLTNLGFVIEKSEKFPVNGFKLGANRNRVEFETISLFWNAFHDKMLKDATGYLVQEAILA